MSKVGEEYGIGGGGVGSLGGNGGEIMRYGHGGRGLKWWARARCLLPVYRYNKRSRANHSVPKMMGRNVEDLMSAAVERSTSVVGSQ
jgi:hypothetical protein